MSGAHLKSGKAVPEGVTLVRLRGATVRRSSDQVGYYIAAADGTKLSGLANDRGTQVDMLARWRKALSQRKRRCMTCPSEFMSEGSHNRMCDRCRYSKSDQRGGV